MVALMSDVVVDLGRILGLGLDGFFEESLFVDCGQVWFVQESFLDWRRRGLSATRALVFFDGESLKLTRRGSSGMWMESLGGRGLGASRFQVLREVFLDSGSGGLESMARVVDGGFTLSLNLTSHGMTVFREDGRGLGGRGERRDSMERHFFGEFGWCVIELPDSPLIHVGWDWRWWEMWRSSLWEALIVRFNVRRWSSDHIRASLVSNLPLQVGLVEL